MKNLPLATWMEHCADYVAPLKDSLGTAVFEGVLHAVTTGQAGMLASILEGAARNAVATGRGLDGALASLQAVKLIIWRRLEAEIDPDRAWDWLVGLEVIFQLAAADLFEGYAAALAESHRRQLSEAARLSRDAEDKVMAYAAQLARANRELARLDQAKTDFISIAAHELKTPLTVVQGYIDMLVESAGPERNAQLLDRIAGGTARLAAIVNDLLDVSAIETGSLDVRFEPVMVDSIVKLLLDQKTAATQSRRLTLRAELEPELPVIYSDPRRLHQILERLAGNAIKYTPDGGTITITAGLESGGGDDAPWVKLEVADTGIGIAPEDRDHIFDKFYRVGQTELHSTGRVKFKGAGPGLGLSIAKGIVEALNGQLWVESPGYDEVNCPGSTFYLRLPAGEPPDDAPSS